MKRTATKIILLIMIICANISSICYAADRREDLRQQDIYYILEDKNGIIVDSGFYSADARVTWNYEIPSGNTLKFTASNPNGLWAEEETIMAVSYSCSSARRHTYKFMSKTYGEQHDFTYTGSRTKYSAEYYIGVSDYYYSQITNHATDSLSVSLSIKY